MKILMKAYLLISVLLVSACVSYIHTEVRPIEEPGELGNGTTYQWKDSNLSIMAPKEEPSSTFSNHIREEVDISLAALGYTESPQAEPDFYIDAVLTLRTEEAQRVEMDILSNEDPYLPYALEWKLVPKESIVKPDPAFPHMEISYYQKGTLHIGAFDKTGAIAWHGEAHKIIEMAHTPNEHRGVLRKAARQLMLKFPQAPSQAN